VLRGIAADRIVTCDPARPGPLGAIDDGAIVLEKESIRFVGPRAHAPPHVKLERVRGVVTPGLVDAHTHAVWAGSRHLEYAVRMAGGDYRAIAAAGGGIVSTHAAVREATLELLAHELADRLERMAALGVTTVEVKSGYGLLPEHERKQLEAIAAVRVRSDLPRIVPTYLALHALPPEFSERRHEFVLAATDNVKVIAQAGLASFVDAYVDPHAFTVEEARALGRCARNEGLGVRLHAGQFGDIGGAELAAELGAKSVDHLEHVSALGIAALARAGTAAVLLPVASFTLAQPPPPIADLRAGGVPLVVASDANPGTAPTESLPLAMAFAVRTYGLTPEEAILGATRNAAATLSCEATGMLREGDPADLVVWDLPHENAIIQPWGLPKARLVIRDGAGIASRLP
jgi:imidazolonepropionase